MADMLEALRIVREEMQESELSGFLRIAAELDEGAEERLRAAFRAEAERAGQLPGAGLAALLGMRDLDPRVLGR